ncbi:hypothetical protein UPYG_G00026400 [Umbra pygmaea]|uniref:Uncharacterized protein n=1 Tax=Umbra pygmaea TaxID=75934 RepID=A0ABD0Y0I9_UMBPY
MVMEVQSKVEDCRLKEAFPQYQAHQFRIPHQRSCPWSLKQKTRFTQQTRLTQRIHTRIAQRTKSSSVGRKKYLGVHLINLVCHIDFSLQIRGLYYEAMFNMP